LQFQHKAYALVLHSWRVLQIYKNTQNGNLFEQKHIMVDESEMTGLSKRLNEQLYMQLIGHMWQLSLWKWVPTVFETRTTLVFYEHPNKHVLLWRKTFLFCSVSVSQYTAITIHFLHYDMFWPLFSAITRQNLYILCCFPLHWPKFTVGGRSYCCLQFSVIIYRLKNVLYII
jgi:hypothetical protein